MRLYVYSVYMHTCTYMHMVHMYVHIICRDRYICNMYVYIDLHLRP